MIATLKVLIRISRPIPFVIYLFIFIFFIWQINTFLFFVKTHHQCIFLFVVPFAEVIPISFIFYLYSMVLKIL